MKEKFVKHISLFGILRIILVLYFLPVCSLGQNQNLSNGYIFEGEPYIAVDPFDHQHLVVAWMGYIPLLARISIKIRVSFDGGLNWSPVVIIPHQDPSYTSADPSLAFDNEGNLYLSYVDYNSDSGRGAVYLLKSTDGGLTWGEPVEVISSEDDVDKPIDRPWLKVDTSNGPASGNIYITTIPPRVFGWLPPPYHPYLSISTDGGSSFSWRYIDTTGWLAGNFIRQPMAMHDVSTNGVLHVVYPSYGFGGDSLFKYIHALSYDGGLTFTYHTIFSTSSVIEDTLVKKGYLILVDPTDDEHLVFVYLSEPFGDVDVFMRESFDGGQTWAEAVRVNDDPIGNNRMQDMVWADFDVDGDLVVVWRDRRNGEDSTYAASYEIWGAFRDRDSSHFSSNFRISDTLIPFSPLLNGSGNDFLCVELVDDTLYAVWGDTRNGRLDIWFQKMWVRGEAGVEERGTSRSQIGIGSQLRRVYMDPNTSILHIDLPFVEEVKVYNVLGSLLMAFRNVKFINMTTLPSGVYLVNIKTDSFNFSRKILKLR